MRKFYGNTKIKAHSFEIEVKKVKINLTKKRLEILIRAPTEGAEKLDDKSSGLRFLFGRDDVMHFEKISARDLSMEHRFFHHMTVRILLSQIGRFDFVTKNDIAIMHHMIKKEKFNLPTIILKVLQKSALKGKLALPYGMFLTLVFKDCGVNLEKEPSKLLQHYA